MFTPGHSPGHVTFSIPDEQAVFSGDVLFQGSVGPHRPARRRLGARCSSRSARCTDTLPAETTVYPGHMGITTLGAERATNPFLSELARLVAGEAPGPAGDVRRAARGRQAAATARPATDDVLGAAGYEPFETPGLREHRAVRARGGGVHGHRPARRCSPSRTKAGRSLTLRPEGTAGVCRAYVEHGMHKLPQPVKLWYWGPFFRHEAPQAGRYRQFTQVGSEALGSDEPSLDAEAILLLVRARLARPGAEGLRLRLSSLGTPETRARVPRRAARLPARARGTSSPSEVRERIDANPLRAFDADDPGTRAVMVGAPRLLDRLAPEDAEHFDGGAGAARRRRARLRDRPDARARARLLHAHRVRVPSPSALGAQSGVGGGGRYDGLVEQLGGPATPGVGWAAGIERILLVSDGEAEAQAPDVYVALPTGGDSRTAFALVRGPAHRGPGGLELEQAGRSIKGQLKHADRIGARLVLIVGDEGLASRATWAGRAARLRQLRRGA